MLSNLYNFYHPQLLLRKGNDSTSVCQEFCPRGACGVSASWSKGRSASGSGGRGVGGVNEQNTIVKKCPCR